MLAVKVAPVNDPPVARSFTVRVIADSVAVLTLNATVRITREGGSLGAL